MSTNRMIGVAVLVAGVVLLVIGMNASGSMADKMTNTFTGHYTDKTTWYIVGGMALGVLGLLVTLFGGGRGAHV